MKKTATKANIQMFLEFDWKGNDPLSICGDERKFNAICKFSLVENYHN